MPILALDKAISVDRLRPRCVVRRADAGVAGVMIKAAADTRIGAAVRGLGLAHGQGLRALAERV